MMSVPLLGIPVLNRGDLLKRCVESIDFPVDRLVVINNGRDDSVRACLAWLEERLANIEVVTPRRNLGVAGSWNYFLQHYDVPYYLICGNDIQFSPCDLEKMSNFVEEHLDYAIMFGNHGYSLFALTQYGKGLVGYFDENFYPAYLEDCDHYYRVKLLGGKSCDISNIHAIHGEPPHWGSSTILSNPRFRERNGITHGNNFRYYRAKWGGINDQEVYQHPFDVPEKSPRDWSMDDAHRKANDIWDTDI